MENARHTEDEEQPQESIHEQQGSDQLLQGDLDPGNEGTSIVIPLEDDDL